MQASIKFLSHFVFQFGIKTTYQLKEFFNTSIRWLFGDRKLYDTAMVVFMMKQYNNVHELSLPEQDTNEALGMYCNQGKHIKWCSLIKCLAKQSFRLSAG